MVVREEIKCTSSSSKYPSEQLSVVKQKWRILFDSCHFFVFMIELVLSLAAIQGVPLAMPSLEEGIRNSKDIGDVIDAGQIALCVDSY